MYYYITETQTFPRAVHNQTLLPSNDEPLIAEMAERYTDVNYFVKEN